MSMQLDGRFVCPAAPSSCDDVPEGQDEVRNTMDLSRQETLPPICMAFLVQLFQNQSKLCGTATKGAQHIAHLFGWHVDIGDVSVLAHDGQVCDNIYWRDVPSYYAQSAGDQSAQSYMTSLLLQYIIKVKELVADKDKAAIQIKCSSLLKETWDWQLQPPPPKPLRTSLQLRNLHTLTPAEFHHQEINKGGE